MKILTQAEVSLYPLGGGDISSSVKRFAGILVESGLEVEVGKMSSIVVGESERLFSALRSAYEHVAEAGPVVMVLKLSNACPT